MTIRDQFLEVARLAWHLRQVDGSKDYDASKCLQYGRALDAAILALDAKLRRTKRPASGKRKRKTPRRKDQHWIIGSVLPLERRQSPERRAMEIQGNFETCGACGNQKARGATCSTCYGKR